MMRKISWLVVSVAVLVVLVGVVDAQGQQHTCPAPVTLTAEGKGDFEAALLEGGLPPASAPQGFFLTFAAILEKAEDKCTESLKGSIRKRIEQCYAYCEADPVCATSFEVAKNACEGDASEDCEPTTTWYGIGETNALRCVVEDSTTVSCNCKHPDEVKVELKVASGEAESLGLGSLVQGFFAVVLGWFS